MMNVNGKERAIDLTKPGRERMYLTHEAKGHEMLVALGNSMAAGSSKSTGPVNSFHRTWKPRSLQRRSRSGTCTTCTAPRGSPYMICHTNGQCSVPYQWLDYVVCLTNHLVITCHMTCPISYFP